MQDIFREKVHIPSYELDADGRLRLSAALRIMQETAGNHLRQDGLTYRFMRDRGCVFLLTRVGLRLLRLPGWDETITVETWFVRTKGAEYLRNMRFYDEKGAVVLEARTFWVTADPQTHRILRPQSVTFIQMPAETAWPLDLSVEKLRPEGKIEPIGERRVVYSDLDSNRHMNNAVYADIVCDFYPDGYLGRSARFLQLDFLGEALFGETIHLFTGRDKHGRVLLLGDTDSHRCFEAAVEAA